MELKGRITAKKLVEWCNSEFERFGINNYVVTEILRTHYTRNDYECGACRLIVRFKDKTVKEGSLVNGGAFMCFYKLSELEGYLKDGYSLCLKDKKRFGALTDFEIDVRKTFTQQS